MTLSASHPTPVVKDQAQPVNRQAHHAVDPLFINRWSPRAFTGESIADAELFSLFEAARWAPSANNSQPWRFVYSKRDSARWPEFLALLSDKNRLWASRAAALVVLVSKTAHVRPGSTEATPLRSHSLDAGAAWASLAFQAEQIGWRTHAIGGFDRDKARDLLGIPDGFHVEVAIAVGRQASLSVLAEEFHPREQPTPRLPLASTVAADRFDFASQDASA